MHKSFCSICSTNLLALQNNSRVTIYFHVHCDHSVNSFITMVMVFVLHSQYDLTHLTSELPSAVTSIIFLTIQEVLHIS